MRAIPPIHEPSHRYVQSVSFLKEGLGCEVDNFLIFWFIFATFKIQAMMCLVIYPVNKREKTHTFQ